MRSSLVASAKADIAGKSTAKTVFVGVATWTECDEGEGRSTEDTA